MHHLLSAYLTAIFFGVAYLAQCDDNHLHIEEHELTLSGCTRLLMNLCSWA
jgi:hypothetical protein